MTTIGHARRLAALPLIAAVLLASLAALFGPAPRSALAASVITQWNFNSSTPTAPSLGSGALVQVGTTGAQVSGGASSDTVPALSNFAWNITGFAPQNTANESRGLRFNVSTVGQQNIVVRWDQRHSPASARHARFQYSLDGTNFLSLGELFVADAADRWSNRREVDLSGVEGVANNPNFAFRIVAAFDPALSTYVPTGTGVAYATNSTWRFDMVTVSGDPTGGPQAPTITSQPQDRSIASGLTTTLSVAASGTSPLSYQWYQGLAGDTSQPVGTNSPSFTTPPLTATTSYWVRVSNAVGSVDSRVATVTVAAPNPCQGPVTRISVVQGSGLRSSFAGPGEEPGQTVTVRGVVVGDYEGSGSLRGFYLQDQDQDGDPASSEGIFVFNSSDADNVQLGQLVQATGAVREFQGQTQINRTASEFCGTTATVEPADLRLPVPAPQGDVPFMERLEGMLVRASGSDDRPLVVTEHFQLGRFGQITVSGGQRLFQPTNLAPPGAAASALQAQNTLNRLILDDAIQTQNRDPIYFGFGRNGQPLSAANTLRIGDSVPAAVGVLTFTWGGNSASPNAYRLRPERALGVSGPPAFQPTNPRPTVPPPPGGTLKVSAFNVLNYFLTLDAANSCGPQRNQECRGADSDAEFQRQRAKLLAALRGLDADVLGLVELENTAGVNPQADLANGLNQLIAPGLYSSLDTGTIGGDAIRVGILYKPGAVTPVGPFKILDRSVDPAFNSDIQRPSLAQTFQVNATGARFTVVVNHFKSKNGSGLETDQTCTTNPSANLDCDQGDGQGFWNATRTAAARAVLRWLASDPTASGDPDYLILGDLNAYAQEDPVRTLLAGLDGNAGSTDDNSNLIARFNGERAYSYLFDGQSGYLDHAIASPSLATQVTGATEWHINADEPSILDYNVEFKSAGQVNSLYAPDQYRTSDHDPVLVGMNLVGPARGPALAVTASYDSGLGEMGAAIVSVRGNRAVLSNAADGSIDILDTADLLDIRRLQRVEAPFLAGVSSVAIHPSRDLFLAVTGSSGPPRGGALLAFRLSNGELLAAAPFNRQPAAVAISPDGRFAVVAIEAEQVSASDDGGPGAIGVVDLSSFDPAAPASLNLQLIEFPDISGVPGVSVNRQFDVPGNPLVTNAPGTIEPEGVAFAPDSRSAYITLQENNAVARLDLAAPLPATMPVAAVFGLGRVNLLTDLTNNGTYSANQPLDTFREPDGIAVFEAGGVRYVVTADEGDTRPTPRGGRTISVFNAATGAFVADAGDQLNAIAARYGVYSDSRSTIGGVEPAMLDISTVNGRIVAAVSLERADAIALVDLTNPAAPFATGLVRTGASPEGVALVVRNSTTFALTANATAGTLTTVVLPAAPAAATLFYQPGSPRPFGLAVIDSDSSAITATLTLAPADAGSLSRSSFSGSVAAINAALASLSFTPAPEFRGPAVIEVSVGDGTTVVSGTLTLDPPPSTPLITAQPQNTTVQSGQAATLNVAAIGVAPLRYQWYRGAAGDTSNPIAGATAATFTTPALTVTTSYWVRVSNDLGSADSITALVTVVPPPNQPPTLTRIALFTGLALGQPYTLTYEALAAATDASDPEGQPLRFRVEALLSGSLTKGGTPVSPGTTLLGPGESLVYTPNALGPSVAGFTVGVTDGSLASAPVEVRFAVGVRLYLPLTRR